jgi:Ca2+-binding RTX toxin-like protein
VPAADPSAAQLVIGIDADNTVIAGGPADDTIFAGKGLHQTLTGAGGADVFVFANSGPVDDTITDFDPASDKLDLRGLIKPSDIVEVAAEASGSVLKIADSQIHLANVAPSSLTTADFVQSVELHIIGGAVS